MPIGHSSGWQKGDWICSCGFHDYSSREQVLLRTLSYSFDAKVFDLVSVFTGSATSAMLLCHQVLFYHKCQNYTSEKREVSVGYIRTCQELHSFWAAECVPLSDQIAVSGGKQTGVYPPPSYPSRSSATEPNLPVNLQFHRVATMAMILGKGNEVICKVAKLALFRRSSMSYAKFLQCCT
ncbi:hypothetical protein RHMOL_Rhmol08G0040700 [Rhododendron molle]|uniref:Uncharacterized protein n=1 Tax=Rhododendron molle TaxID=49168 RepID=A0ACC0MK91_RHOML|nr:hypothetical protein RHMOL_Rhmol08G0040700 [Rhododendron molle]